MHAAYYRVVSGFFKALSHPTRVMIVLELQAGKKCVSDIKGLVKVPQPNISQHLSILKSNGLVDWRQEGKRKCYFLKNRLLMKKIMQAIETTVSEKTC